MANWEMCFLDLCTFATYITNPERELFVSIIQWIDRTHITGNARFSLKPYMFPPAIFTEPFRRTIQAWGYHGFLPKTKLSSAQNKNLNQGDNVRNYHAQLSAVLETFRTANARLRNVTLPIGTGGMLTVDVKTCILFIIQDMQEYSQHQLINVFDSVPLADPQATWYIWGHSN
jgi:hypothetical protein